MEILQPRPTPAQAPGFGLAYIVLYAPDIRDSLSVIYDQYIYLVVSLHLKFW